MAKILTGQVKIRFLLKILDFFLLLKKVA